MTMTCGGNAQGKRDERRMCATKNESQNSLRSIAKEKPSWIPRRVKLLWEKIWNFGLLIFLLPLIATTYNNKIDHELESTWSGGKREGVWLVANTGVEPVPSSLWGRYLNRLTYSQSGQRWSRTTTWSFSDFYANRVHHLSVWTPTEMGVFYCLV